MSWFNNINKSLITILFKSGNKINVRVSKFTVEKQNGRISKIIWSDDDPHLMFVSCDDIECIIESKI